MPTLFNRMYAYAKQNGLQVLTTEQKVELGKSIAKKYHEQDGVKKRLRKIKAKPFDCEGSVLNYPIEYKDEMDAQIKEYYINNSMPKLSKKKKHKK